MGWVCDWFVRPGVNSTATVSRVLASIATEVAPMAPALIEPPNLHTTRSWNPYAKARRDCLV
jgi:hypothetical protein